MLLKNYCNVPVTVIVKTTRFNEETQKIEEVITEETHECGKLIRIAKSIYDTGDPDTATHAFHILACGHVVEEKLTPTVKPESQRHKILWNMLLPYQKKSVIFLEKNKGRALLAHDVGLGKTVISLSYLRENPHTVDKLCLIVTQAGDIYRWREEALIWLGLKGGHLSGDFGSDELLEQFIKYHPTVYHTRGQQLPPHDSGIVISSWTRLSDDYFVSQLKERGISCVILDESHMYKNESSKRTRNLQNLIHWADRQNSHKIPVIFLTATPISNRLSEYTTTLNILDPEYFPTKESVLKFCAYDFGSKKYLGLSERYRDMFFSRTKKYIMRETAKTVNLPLPKREDSTIEIDVRDWKNNEAFVKEYNELLDSLERELQSSQVDAGSVIGIMSQLRRLTGMMKVAGVAELATEFLTMNPDEKLTIGIHHISVHQWLQKFLESMGFGVLVMTDESPELKDAIEEEFKTNPQKRVLIASVISAGHGRNLQFCRNAMLAERQWNRTVEDQFFGRFHRIVKNEDGTVKTEFTDADTVHCIKINAKETMDEYFEKMVEFKGGVVDTADEAAEDQPSTDFLITLAREMVRKRIKWVGV